MLLSTGLPQIGRPLWGPWAFLRVFLGLFSNFPSFDATDDAIVNIKQETIGRSMGLFEGILGLWARVFDVIPKT